MATEETLVEIGAPVKYHGSLTHYHGPAQIIDVHTDGYVFEDGSGGTRYTLRYGPSHWQVLYNVRRVSFTPTEEI